MGRKLGFMPVSRLPGLGLAASSPFLLAISPSSCAFARSSGAIAARSNARCSRFWELGFLLAHHKIAIGDLWSFFAVITREAVQFCSIELPTLTLRITFMHSLPNFSAEVHSPDQEVVIALASNVALRLMRKSGIRITRHGCLYETAPVYVTDQPNFLNSAVRAVTQLGPHELLRALKKIEKDMGHILFHGKRRISSEILRVHHEQIWERPFVMAPLMDLLGSTIDSDTVSCWHSFSLHSGGLFDSWEKLGGEPLVGKEGLKRVLPIGNGFLDWSTKTAVMGMFNLTPDRFSDGGKFQSVDAAISQVCSMISEGADMIDIGAQSTRPMASRISVQQGLDRLTPVLEAVLGLPEAEGKIVSVDTFYSEVAAEEVSKGAHIVNDNLQYDNACKQVASELYLKVREAEILGILAWRMIIDPGLGFSKNREHNLEILMGLPNIQAEIGRKSLALSCAPILIGPSRKKFLGEVCNHTAATERDAATVASVTAAVLGGANIVRVHNVRDNVDAVKLCDAILRQRRSIPPSSKK
ncbi:unnamed protein product [Malus baccata var. baccata]